VYFQINIIFCSKYKERTYLILGKIKISFGFKFKNMDNKEEEKELEALESQV